MNTKETDHQLIQQVLNGHKAVFGLLVEKYQHSIYALVRRIVRDEAEAQDVAQSVFIKAYEKLGSFNHKSLFSTWLHSIAYNAAISVCRRKKPDLVRLDAFSVHHFDTDEDEADKKEAMLRLLEEVLTILPPEENILIHLFYTSGHSMAEISEITGMTIANIKVKLFRIRKKLLGLIENASVKHLN